MKLTKAEKWVLGVTLLFLVLTAGYQIGRKRVPAEFTVRTAAEALPEETPAVRTEELPAEGAKVNINTAGAEELRTLDGIGETLAERIIAYREEHGPFAAAEDITNVSGIGEGTLEKLRDRICTD